MKVRRYDSTSKKDFVRMKNLMLELCKVTGSEFDENRFNNTIQRRVSDKKNRQGILLAEDNKKIVGMLLAEVLVSPFIETYGNLSNFVVSPDYRGKGVGKTLLDKAFEFFRDMGVNRVETNIRELPKEGKLFKRYGFVKKYIVLEKKIPMEEFSRPY